MQWKRLVGEAIFERKKRPWPWKFPSPVLSFTWCEKMFLLLYLFFINVALLVSEATPLYSFLGDLGGNNSLFGHLLVKSSREVMGRCERVESLKFLVIANVSFELKNQSYASGFMEPFKEELCNLELSQECHHSVLPWCCWWSVLSLPAEKSWSHSLLFLKNTQHSIHPKLQGRKLSNLAILSQGWPTKQLA